MTVCPKCVEDKYQVGKDFIGTDFEGIPEISNELNSESMNEDKVQLFKKVHADPVYTIHKVMYMTW